MSKEKLRFRINGQNISYEGFPENRHKDLMDILAKMGVSQDSVVGTFRENIDDQENYSDDQIVELFSAAVAVRAAKKKARAAAPASDSSAAPKAEEKPQRITLVLNGKQFSYEGLPSGKQSAVIQLLCKQSNITPAVAAEAYRENLPGVTETDDEIWAMVTEAQAARAARKGGSRTAAAESHHHHQDQQQQQQQQAQTEAEAGQPSHLTDAMDTLANMTTKERDDIQAFINQVVANPTSNIGFMVDDPPPTTAAHRAQKQQQEEEDAPEMMNTARAMTMAGKVAVYCQEKGTTGTKVIYATQPITFEDFSALVEKKFGRKMALSFYEDEDIIELDDDDVLAMFLDMSMHADAKKLKLICSDPATRAVVQHDAITEGTTAAGAPPKNVKVQAYSNGELTVKEVRTYCGHSLPVYSCAFSPKGDEFVSASRDKSVRLWDMKTGSNTVMRGGHNGFVLSCDFSPKGNRVVSSSDDETIKVWNTTNCSKVSTLRGHSNKVYCVRYSQSGDYIVSGSCDRTVRVWNADSCSKLATLKGHTLPIFSCCFSHDKRSRYVASGSDDRLIKIWDWEANKEVRSLVGHIGTVWSVNYSHSDEFIVSASMDHELKLWEAKSGTCLRTMVGHKASIHDTCFSDDDKYIFSCARDWSVMVWRTSDGERVEIITGHTSSVYHMDVRGNKLLTCSLDDTIKLWDVIPNK